MFIGITGKARSGKDTFAEMLAEELFNLTRQRYVLMAFAHELKIRVQRDFDLSYEQLWGNEKEIEDRRYMKAPKHRVGVKSDKDELPNIYWTPREILQVYGEFYRSVNYSFWVNHLFEIIDDRKYTNVIITDVRYINEADSITKRKGILAKIVRDENNNVHGQSHISEVAMDYYKGIEFTIKNDEGLEEIKAAAKKTARALINKK